MKELILGGARSGKSTLALARARASGRDVVFIATATASDAEMAARIERHRRERPAHWRTLECPVLLGATLGRLDALSLVIVDCLTLWLTNILFPHTTADRLDSDETTFERETASFYASLQHCASEIVT